MQKLPDGLIAFAIVLSGAIQFQLPQGVEPAFTD
jgi:hypothetical protein